MLETLTGVSPGFVVTSWRMQQGLPSDRVRAVVQTRDSYLWVATFNGAAQFDGVQFRVFNDANTPELRNSLINCLFEDAEGRLWFGSDTGEVTWRDEAGFHARAITNAWPSLPVDRFAESADGTFWILNRDGFLLAVRNLKAQGVLGNRRGPRYSDILRDTAGQVWAVRHGGVLYEAASGDVWVGTRDDGAFMVAADGSEHHLNRATGLAHDLVSGIGEDREGNLWIGSDAGGLSHAAPTGVVHGDPAGPVAASAHLVGVILT